MKRGYDTVVSSRGCVHLTDHFYMVMCGKNNTPYGDYAPKWVCRTCRARFTRRAVSQIEAIIRAAETLGVCGNTIVLDVRHRRADALGQ